LSLARVLNAAGQGFFNRTDDRTSAFVQHLVSMSFQFFSRVSCLVVQTFAHWHSTSILSGHSGGFIHLSNLGVSANHSSTTL